MQKGGGGRAGGGQSCFLVRSLVEGSGFRGARSSVGAQISRFGAHIKVHESVAYH